MKKEYCNWIYVAWGVDCPPSVKKELDDILTRHSIDKVEDFCRKTETEVMSISELTPYMRKKLKDFMNHYDLRFGMTLEDMNEYKDREYFLRHPEERAIINSNDDEEEKEKVFEQDFLNNLPPDKKEKMEDENFNETEDYLPIVDPDEEQNEVEEESDEEKQQLLEAKAKERMEEIDRILFFNYDPSASIRPEEWEITIHSATIRFMAQDSFLTKLFVSDKKRLSRAFKNAKNLYEMLREDASKRGKQVQENNKKLIIERNTLRNKFSKLFNPGFHR